jgi:hypothetical protein
MQATVDVPLVSHSGYPLGGKFCDASSAKSNYSVNDQESF